MGSYKDRCRAVEEALKAAEKPANGASQAARQVSAQQIAQPAPALPPPITEGHTSLSPTARLDDMNDAQLLELARSFCSQRGISDASTFCKTPDLNNLSNPILTRGIMNRLFPAAPVASAAPSDSIDANEAKRMRQRLNDVMNFSCGEHQKLKTARRIHEEEETRLSSPGAPGISMNQQLLALSELQRYISEQEAKQNKIDTPQPEAGLPASMPEAVVAPAAEPAGIAFDPQVLLLHEGRARRIRGRSTLGRFFSSPTLWGTVVAGSLVFAMNSRDGFTEIATFIQRVMESNRSVSGMITGFWQTTFHLPWGMSFRLPHVELSSALAYGLYGTIGLGFVWSMLSKYRTAKAVANDYAGVGVEEFEDMRSRVISQVPATINCKEPGVALCEKLVSDEELFNSLDTLRRNPMVFCAVMHEAHVPVELLNGMDMILAHAEANIVTNRLKPYLDKVSAERLAPYHDNGTDTERLKALEALYSNDALLRQKLDETFQKDRHGMDAYPVKKQSLTSVFIERVHGEGQLVLLQLEKDYHCLLAQGNT